MPRKKKPKTTILIIKPDNSFLDYLFAVSDSNYTCRGQYQGFFESANLRVWGVIEGSEDKRLPPHYDVLLEFSPDDSYGLIDDEDDRRQVIGHVRRETKGKYLKITVDIPRRSFSFISLAAMTNNLGKKIRVEMTRLDYNHAAVLSISI